MSKHNVNFKNRAILRNAWNIYR